MKLILDEWIVREVIDTLYMARTTFLGITGLDSPQDVEKKSANETAITRRISKAIDIIQQSEQQPMPESLEEAAEEYIKKGRYLPEAFVVRPAFIAGAEWQKEQPDFPTTDEQVKEFLATHPKIEVPEKYKNPDWLFKKQEQPEVDLEKAAEEYATTHLRNNEFPTADSAFIAGAKWQAERDDRDVVFWKGMQYAIKWMEEDAVDGIYTKSIDGKNVFVESSALKIDPASVKVGDPVRIIVLPKEDEK